MKMLSAAEIENATCRDRAEPVAIWKARKYIKEHAGEELSLTKVANVVNMNANYLSESFKQVTGTNFVEYVRRIRYENARELLRNSNRRISEIAFAVGFQSLSQFNRVFKKAIRKIADPISQAPPTRGVKYWEIIADNLSKAGWSLGWVSAVDSEGRQIWIVDAHGVKAFHCAPWDLRIICCSAWNPCSLPLT